jgi:hypothetical protein
MSLKLIAILVAAALGAAACGKDEPKSAQPASGGSTAAPAQSQANTPQANTQTTPANIGQPQSMAERREGANPTQQQVDPKQSYQHRDFQRDGDQAGPRSPETTPGPGTGK